MMPTKMTMTTETMNTAKRKPKPKPKRPPEQPSSTIRHHHPRPTLPSPPHTWPQAPLMIRSTPSSSTRIKGIRKLCHPPSANKDCDDGSSSSHCLLPINNGTETKGQSMVIDFESRHFIGTLLMRIKQAPTLPVSSWFVEGDDHCQDKELIESAGMDVDDNRKTSTTRPSYFRGKKRTFQVVVRGRFRQSLLMSQTVTGQAFDRPAGKLPAPWIVHKLIQFFTTLAPQLQVQLYGTTTPRLLSPLVATAHTVLQHAPMSHPTKTNNDAHDDYHLTDTADAAGVDRVVDMDDERLEEVHMSHASSIVPLVYQALGGRTIQGSDKVQSSTVLCRMKARKRAFHQLVANKTITTVNKNKSGPSSADSTSSSSLRFDVSKEYTFEFYQHLLDFGPDELALDMGWPLGKVGMAKVTNGQPLKIMSAWQCPMDKQRLEDLWSFEIWHESLFQYAQR